MGNRDPYKIMVLLSLMTAVASAALDNVTVVVLIAPVTLFVANNLGISPIPFLIAEVLASNIGGAATLIGDPPNILIGSAASIDFISFFVNMIVPVTISLILFVPLSYVVFRKDLRVEEGSRPRVTELEGMITDPVLLRKSLIVIGGVLLGFIFHGVLHLEPATFAMFGATVLMLWTRKESHEVFHHVEWNTLMFFVGLFIAVEAIVEVGIIEMIANAALNLTGGDLALTTHAGALAVGRCLRHCRQYSLYGDHDPADQKPGGQWHAHRAALVLAGLGGRLRRKLHPGRGLGQRRCGQHRRTQRLSHHLWFLYQEKYSDYRYNP